MLCCNILPTSSLTAPLEREKWQMLLWLCEQGDGMHSFYLLQTEKLYIMAWKGEKNTLEHTDILCLWFLHSWNH